MTDSLPEPCPVRIIFNTGFGFAMGAVGGTAFHFPKGLYHSPGGERFIGGAQAVRMNAPRLAGTFAVWGGLYSTFACAIAYARQKDDPWNTILAGGAASSLLAIRKGFGPMGTAALSTAALFALLHGMASTLEKAVSAEQHEMRMQPVTFEEVPQMGDKTQLPAALSSWFGGLFGQKK